MGYELRTNTAVRIPVGPLVDPTDGKTAETELDVTALLVQLYQIKTDGTAVVRTAVTPTASGGDNDMALVVDSTDGVYDFELTAAQLNWLGNGRITFYDVDGFLVHWIDISVVSANYFDAKYGTGNLNADLKAILATTLTETSAGYLAAAFKKLFDVETPLLVASDVMRGTDGAALASVWTAEKAGYIPVGLMPTQAEVLAIQNNTRVRVIVPPCIERPDAGSTTYRLWLYVYDEAGNMEEPDSTPTIHAQNNTGVSRNANLSAVTLAATGVYYVDYTVASDHALEGLLFDWRVTENSVARTHGAQALVVDTTAVDFTAADRTKLEAIHTKLPSRSYLTGSEAATGETQTDAAAALNAYDPPTNAEMEARTLVAANYATATNLATVDTVADGIKATTDKLDSMLEVVA